MNSVQWEIEDRRELRRYILSPLLHGLMLHVVLSCNPPEKVLCQVLTISCHSTHCKTAASRVIHHSTSFHIVSYLMSVCHPHCCLRDLLSQINVITLIPDFGSGFTGPSLRYSLNCVIVMCSLYEYVSL